MAEIFRFGSFELDPLRGELRRDGAVVKLAPQPFRALHLLVSRAGTLVTRDELRAALWDDGSFVDFNAGLNFCIGQVRTAIDDPAAASRLLVSVPRRGYKFVAPVTRVPRRATEPAAIPSRPEPRGRSPWAIAGAAAVAASVATVALLRASAPAPPAEPPPAANRDAAVERFARGNLALADAGPQELLSRVDYFTQAIAADAGFADAHAGLADARITIGNYRVQSPQASYAAARSAATRAVQIAPGSAAAHAALGMSLLYLDWDWRAARTHLERAVQLDDASARAHQWYSRYLSASGDARGAVYHARRAVTLAPGSASARTDLGLAHFYAGDFKEAIDACAEAARMLPQFVPAQRCAADAAAEAGDAALALRWMTTFAPQAAADLRDATAHEGLAGFWRQRVTRLETGMTDADCDRRAWPLAVALVHHGRPDRAIDWLQRAANQRTDVLVFAAVHPAFRPLRGDPDFESLLRRVGVRPD
jgi:DNA-binding winged helix-turn-helix (wHTH) protein/tetratricopeptide (TPR) repeat protein